MDVALGEGYHMLHSQNYVKVIPAALQALKYSKELYGNSDVRVVPAYMVIARAAIGTCVCMFRIYRMYYSGICLTQHPMGNEE